MSIQIAQIKEFLNIVPAIGDNGKSIKWNHTTGLFEFFLANYVTTVARESSESNRIKFTLVDGSFLYLTLGALAWLDNLDTVTEAVSSVFGRTGAITAQSGDYTAAQVTNAFNKLVDTLDGISEGITNKHLTATLLDALNANTSARHSHTNKSILDLIENAGSGQIVTDAERTLWNSYTSTNAAFIISTVVALIQNGTGITWEYNESGGTLTPTISLASFTTDNLAEGTANKYYTETNRGIETITLPASSDVATRVAGAVVGTDYPTGWTLAADSVTNLLITHTLTGRKIVDVKVFEIDGNNEDAIKPFENAYSGFRGNAVNDTVIIYGLDTEAIPLRIELLFH